MPLHPFLQTMVDKAAALPPMHTVPLERLRATDVARFTAGVPRVELPSVEQCTMPGPGGPIALRIYKPSRETNLPVVVFFHGSGFILCSLDTHDLICRQLCKASGAIIVSVDYRLAPEHKFPAASDDCLAATRWVAAHAQEFGGDASRIALAGDSAGGNLAAVTALRVRDQGGPALRGQLLVYPVTDHPSAPKASYKECGEGLGLTDVSMRWFWDLYLADQSDLTHPYASPLRAENLRGLPPAYIMTAQYDVLRDEGELYGKRLSEAGVATKVERFSDMNHGFMFWVGVIDPATEAVMKSAAWLREKLG
jgi:acetyl esterase